MTRYTTLTMIDRTSFLIRVFRGHPPQHLVPGQRAKRKNLEHIFVASHRLGTFQVLKYSSAQGLVSAGYHLKRFWRLFISFWVKEHYYQRIWQITQTHEQDLDNVMVGRPQRLTVMTYVFIKSDIHTIHFLMSNYSGRYQRLSVKNWLKPKILEGSNRVGTFVFYFFLNHRSAWEVRNKEHTEGHKTPIKITF